MAGIFVLGESVNGISSAPRAQYNFDLDKAEWQDLINMKGYIAREELKWEQSQGNLKAGILTFNNSSVPRRHGEEFTKAKLGDNLLYSNPQTDIYQLTLDAERMFRAIFHKYLKSRSGTFISANTWTKDRVATVPTPNMEFKYGQELLFYNETNYAKFLEFGTTRNRAFRVFLLLVGRLKRLYGKTFYIERTVVSDVGTPKSGFETNAHYYFARWETARPGIRIRLRHEGDTTIGKT